MYNNESYEQYIRSILGYPNYSNSNFEDNSYYTNNYVSSDIQRNSELEQCYPEIYKIIYPMVTKACSNNMKPNTPDLVDEMTEEIYNSIEPKNEIRVNINLTNETNTNNRNISTNNMKREVESKKTSENRQFKNNGLKDLIRILLIRDLLGNRPPRPQPPIRPPFFEPRPPIMPRNDFNQI